MRHGCQSRRSLGAAQWLERNPAPDLPALIAKFDGYSKITAAAWTASDAVSGMAMALP
jgi:hypothetical protein